MQVTVIEAISRMLRATMQEQGSMLYVQSGERTEVILRGDAAERRILQGPPRVFEQLRARLLEMATFRAPESAMTREGQILYLVDGSMQPFMIRETRSVLEPNACLLTLCYLPDD
ncbi:MAG: hypothetical protein HY321_01980 [Armatimonadetes bacterium]|nr:hypothetical protein [Armatimonadota bacterium]